MKKTSLAITFLALLSVAFTAKTALTKHFDLTGTTWNYEDGEWPYKITFKKLGELSNTNAFDKTPDNDSWEQKENKVFIYFNEKAATYEGELFGSDSIVGHARNESLTWEFKMYRVK